MRTTPYRPSHDRTETALRALAPGWTVPIPNALRPVRVVSVEKTGGAGANSALWTFDIPIFEVWDTIVELQASANGVTFVAPTSTSNPTSFQFAATYAFPISVGCIFRVVAQLESMTFLYDNALALPQRGVIIPAQPTAQLMVEPMMLAATKGIASSKKPRRPGRDPFPGTRRAA